MKDDDVLLALRETKVPLTAFEISERASLSVPDVEEALQRLHKEQRVIALQSYPIMWATPE